jgi:hypothetical protein
MVATNDSAPSSIHRPNLPPWVADGERGPGQTTPDLTAVHIRERAVIRHYHALSYRDSPYK